jgi:hypothetical protein
MFELHESLKKMVLSLGGNATFGYLCQTGAETDWYFSKELDLSMTTPAGGVVSEIAAWNGNEKAWQIKLTKKERE